MVVHSSTKYLGGHGDVVAGVVACSAEMRAALWDVSIQVGGILGAFESWLVLRGIKTLALRMARQCGNAMAIARCLREHPKVRRVHYPGLEDHPQHGLARRKAFEDGDRSFQNAGAPAHMTRRRISLLISSRCSSRPARSSGRL